MLDNLKIMSAYISLCRHEVLDYLVLVNGVSVKKLLDFLVVPSVSWQRL